jgi:hypothetical protein
MSNATFQIASESGHWYEKDGTPAYTQPNKSKPGKMRPTTLRDARKLGLVPSVTSILKMAAKPMLERWKLNQLMLAALTLPAVEGESVSEYEARLWEDANAQSKAAREAGTQIHGYIEAAFQGKTVPNEGMPWVHAVETALLEAFGEQEWIAEKSFASELGFGGKIDLQSPGVIVDYKTKDLAKMDMKNPMSYDNNKMQLSAYRKGLGQHDAKIANLYISRELQEDGMPLVKIEVHDQDYWPHFECLLNFWKLSKCL